MFIVLMVAFAAVSASKDQIVNLAAGDPKVMLGLFNMFQYEYGREYAPAERRMRLANFQQFVKYAAKLNEEDDEVTYGVTLFADLTEAEAEILHLCFIISEDQNLRDILSFRHEFATFTRA